MNTSQLTRMHECMVRIRAAEEALVQPILAGEVRCPCHLYSGEEAVAVGVCAHLNSKDTVFGTHRSHGHYLAMGGSLLSMYAEIHGRDSGCARGRGGSMHLLHPEGGFAGAAPIVAGTISLALGAALAHHIRANGQVAVAFFGDGATGEGVFDESLNFAAIHALPILFVCENNLYSTHMPIAECRPNDNIASSAAPYAMATARVDGNDVLAVYETSERLVRGCRDGKGPALLEALTYRQRGHVGPDDNVQGTHRDIRPPAEVHAWQQRDPIDLFENRLVHEFGFAPAALAAARARIAAEVGEALRAAAQAPWPAKETMLDYVFAR